MRTTVNIKGTKKFFCCQLYVQLFLQSEEGKDFKMTKFTIDDQVYKKIDAKKEEHFRI